MCTRLLLSTNSPQLETKNNRYDIACAAGTVAGGFFMLVSLSVFFYALFKWYRSRHNINPQSPTNTCHSEQPQCIVPIIVYETQASSTVCEYDNNECSICLAEFEQGERLRVLPNCKHVFHVACIDQWIPTRSLNCPVCRDRTINHHDIEPVRTGCRNNNPSSMFGVVNFGMNRL